jgi:threonylcarbamoyladenosine tRNA methylthiotransferase MtaB
LPDGTVSPYNAAAMALKRASLHTLGCRLNQAETAILGEGLRKRGYQIVDFGQPTDLLVLNTCSVTEDAERASRYVIRKTLRHSPQAFVAVTGCYAQTGAESLKRQTGVDLIVGNQYKLDLPDYLPAAEALDKRSAPDLHHTKTIDREDFVLPHYGTPDSTRALLKVQDGCGAMCSFCIIPFARGHERSRTVVDIIREAESLVARGVREVVVTGVNIGQYQERGHDFCAMLRKLEVVAGLERIRISSIEPTTVTDELLDVMAASQTICPYLHIPLQSGDDDVLSAMNRRHTVRAYTQLIERVVEAIPHIGLGTDVMVGFPCETEAAFRNTVDVVSELPFSYLHIFTYSSRPGTAAARMTAQVPALAVKQRSQLLQRLDCAKRLAFNKRGIGTTERVLFESGSSNGYRYGTTSNFTRVAVAINEDLHNQMHSATITAATDRFAIGHIVAEHQQAGIRPIRVLHEQSVRSQRA